MAKRRSYTTRQKQLRKAYSAAASNYNKRIGKWLTTKHYYFEPAPSLTELTKRGINPTQKMINRLNKIRLSNLSPKQMREAERNFTLAYDEGKLDNIMRPKNPMREPRTEHDFLNMPDEPQQQKTEFKTEPTESDEEIEADLWYYIDGVLEEALSYVRSDMMDIALHRASVFRGIYESAIRKVGNKKAFLSYLEDSTTRSRIIEAVTEGIQDSDPKEVTFNDCLQKFVSILIGDAPITTEQSETLEMYGTVDFDYTDTAFDFE